MKIKPSHLALLIAVSMSATVFTGCQYSVAGQNLPSAYFLQDDLQYFPKGSEFKLAREAAAQKEARAEAAADR